MVWLRHEGVPIHERDPDGCLGVFEHLGLHARQVQDGVGGTEIGKSVLKDVIDSRVEVHCRHVPSSHTARSLRLANAISTSRIISALGLGAALYLHAPSRSQPVSPPAPLEPPGRVGYPGVRASAAPRSFARIVGN